MRSVEGTKQFMNDDEANLQFLLLIDVHAIIMNREGEERALMSDRNLVVTKSSLLMIPIESNARATKRRCVA
jgi:hypothetical protein